MTQLIITLPLEPPQANVQLDFLVSADRRSVTSQSRAALALMPQPANAEVVLVLPVQALSWHQVQLPRGLLGKNFLSEGQAPRLRAALEGLLEEQLLDEPSQLHFALAPGARDGAPVWVAACDRAWLTAWLQALEATGHAVSRIVPELSLDDLFEAGRLDDASQPLRTLHVLGTPERAHLVCASAVTAAAQTEEAVGKSSALMVLPLSASAVALAQWPESADILAEPAVAALAESLFNRRVNLQQSAQRWLNASQSPWDLAQFDLQNNSRSRSWKRVTSIWKSLVQAPRWRAARWAAGALVLANVFGLNAWAWAERQSLESKRLAIRDVLTSTFPGVKVVVDAPVQMGRELALLRQGAGTASPGDFDKLLAALGSLELGLVPTGVDFAAQELRVKGLGLSGTQATQVTELLKRQGLNASFDADVLTLKPQNTP